MTLGELMRLYNAEQNGKQIIVETDYSSDYGVRTVEYEVKLSEIELSDIVSSNSRFYVKGER